MPPRLRTHCRKLIPGYDPWADPGPYRFDPKRAQKAVDFFPEYLVHIEGAMAGQPFELQPWQQAVIGNLFGWVDDQGLRRYREVLLYVPRKNGKTPLAAGIACLIFFCDHEAGQQDYVAAADRQQAGLLFRHIKGMVERSQEMRKRCRIYGGKGEAGQTRSLVKSDESFLRVVSADADTKHGGNSHLILVDELHAQPNRELVDVLETSMASENRPQPLAIWITTADYMRPSICNDKYEYAKGVADGRIPDPRFLPVIYESDPADDWKSPAVWAKANPNLGISVSRAYMERESTKAEHDPGYENRFRRLNLNQRTQSATKWLPLDRWDQCEPIAADLHERPCYVGLDLSSTDDLTALALLWPEFQEYTVTPEDLEQPGHAGDEIGSTQLRLAAVDCKVLYWCPEETATVRARRDGVPYQVWIREGWIQQTPGDWVDYSAIRAALQRIQAEHQLIKVGADKWNATHLIQLVQDEDCIECELVAQSVAAMNAGSKQLVELIKRGTFRHDGNPVTRWCAGNAMVDQDAAGNQRPSKKRSAEKIDGVTSIVNAMTIIDERFGGTGGEAQLYVW